MSDIVRIGDPIRDLAKESREEACTHYKVKPKFDAEAARGMNAWEIRARWPRRPPRCRCEATRSRGELG